jgi:hypothetical protein
MSRLLKANWNAVHGTEDATGRYRYERYAEKEGVYVVNSDSEDIPAFGVMIARRLALASDGTGKDESDIYRVEQDYQTGNSTGFIEDALFALVNGATDIGAGRVGVAYPLNDHYPRPALYDTDQFGTPAAGDVLGTIPNTWKLGPGLPGMRCAETGVESNGTVKVIADFYTSAWWAKVTARCDANDITVAANAVADVDSDLVYDGSSATPEVAVRPAFPPCIDIDVHRAPNISVGAYITYTIGVSRNGLNGTRNAILTTPMYDDPVGMGKLWLTSDIANIPTGWAAAANTLGLYTLIYRAN